MRLRSSRNIHRAIILTEGTSAAGATEGKPPAGNPPASKTPGVRTPDGSVAKRGTLWTLWTHARWTPGAWAIGGTAWSKELMRGGLCVVNFFFLIPFSFFFQFLIWNILFML